MALFSTLLSASSEGGDGEALSSSPSSSSNIPTVVQLYTSNALIVEGTTIAASSKGNKPSNNKAAVLSYQAIEVIPSGQEEGIAGGELFGFGMKKGKNVRSHDKPNLGVWNCRIPPTTTGKEHLLVDQLLSVPTSSSISDETTAMVESPSPRLPVYCLTVDLKNPSKVESAISILHESLVRHLILQKDILLQQKHDFASSSSALSPSESTSLYNLRTTQFGLASNDIEGNDKITKQVKTDEIDEKIKFTFMVCAIVPSSSSENNNADGAPSENNKDDSVTYKDKQSQNLILYHLRKYVSKLNGTLCFIQSSISRSSKENNDNDGTNKETKDKGNSNKNDKDKDNASKSETEQATMSIDELTRVWLQLAGDDEDDSSSSERNKSTEEGSKNAEGPTTSDTTEGDTSKPLLSVPMYYPGNRVQYDDIIETVLLRNASCADVWDASKDSLWKALPLTDDDDDPIIRKKKIKEALLAKRGHANGDEEWLLPLKESISSLEASGGTTAADGAAASTKSTTKKKPSGKSTKKDGKGKDDKDAKDFFQNLLKK